MNIKNQTYVIFAILFVIIISVFAVMNVNPVEVNYVFWQGETPLIFVILFCVLLGGVLTTSVGARKFIQLSRENKRLGTEVKELKKISLSDKKKTANTSEVTQGQEHIDVKK